MITWLSLILTAWTCSPTTGRRWKNEDKTGKKTVNARELHAFLGVGKDFSSWIKERITKYEFVEGLDFEVFTNSGETLLAVVQPLIFLSIF